VAKLIIRRACGIACVGNLTKQVALIWPLIVGVGVLPRATSGQTAEGSNSPALVPVARVGWTYFVQDFGEADRASFGLLLGAGVRSSLGEGTFTMGRWPGAGPGGLTTVLFEYSQIVAQRGPLFAAVKAGVGHAWYSPSGAFGGDDGGAGTFGANLSSRIWRAVSLGAEAALRTDVAGWNGEVRVTGTWQFGSQVKAAEGLATSVFLNWMVPVTGPWRYNSPALGVRVGGPVRGRFGMALGMEVVHWRIPGQAFMRDYLWDTRMFVATPTLEWRGGSHWLVRAGPAIAAMGEGPDNGVTAGSVAALEASTGVFGIDLIGTAESLWLPRSGPGQAGEDQIGLRLSVGIGF
jgi:hypothetical protein